jgi:hypothetical protein
MTQRRGELRAQKQIPRCARNDKRKAWAVGYRKSPHNGHRDVWATRTYMTKEQRPFVIEIKGGMGA